MPEVKNSATRRLSCSIGSSWTSRSSTARRPPLKTTAFKRWLADIARATAEAGREGGFLGIGSVTVSDKEEVALTTLRRELGIR